MSVEERFSDVIEELNKNTNSLASELKVSHSAIARVLKGETLPSSKILIPLGKKLGVSIDWLLFGVGEMFIKPPNTKNISRDAGLLQIGDNNKSKNKTSSDGSNKVKEYQKEIEHLNQRLKDKDQIIQSKDEVIDFLKKQ